MFLLGRLGSAERMSRTSGNQVAVCDLGADLRFGAVQGYSGAASLDYRTADLAIDYHGVAGAD